MATRVLDLAAPGLGLAVELLQELHSLYTQLKEGHELCTSLHVRLVGFTELLKTFAPATFEPHGPVHRLQILLEDYAKTVQGFVAQRNFVKRVLKLHQFAADIKVYNERVDSLVVMITVQQSDQLVRLLQWRAQYERDAAATEDRLTTMLTLQSEIWEAIQHLPTKQDVEDMVLVAKRDVGAMDQPDCQPPFASVLRTIVAIGEQDFLDGRVVATPPSWLIDADEVTLVTPPIDHEGYTDIYAGWWEGVYVAVKKFHVMGDSPVFDRHFLVWKTLTHPHVAQLYGAGSDRGAPFFVYEYAGRKSLDQCWGTVSPSELWPLLHQAALGLGYLHRQRVVHGNLSCSKLLVTESGAIKVFGFGASFFRVNNRSNSARPVMCEDFAAPECLGIGADGTMHAQRRSPRFESDIYSFGLTILEAFAHESPFKGMQLKAMLKAKQHWQLPQPLGMHDAEWRLVQQMCALDPSQRVSLAYATEQLKAFAQCH